MYIKQPRYKQCSYYRSIGERLQERLAEIGMSQRELAERIGWDKYELCRFARGYKVPRPEILYKIAAEIGMTMYELLGIDPPGQKEQDDEDDEDD